MVPDLSVGGAFSRPFCLLILVLKINFTARNNELFHLVRISPKGPEVERRETIPVLKIDVTASFKEMFRDCRMPISGRDV